MKLKNIIYAGIGAGIGVSLFRLLKKKETKENPAYRFCSDLASTEAGVPLVDAAESYESDLASRIVEFSENPHNSDYILN